MTDAPTTSTPSSAKSHKGHKLKATFVPMNTVFASREPNPSVLARNSKRWINEFGETEGRQVGDKVDSDYSSDKMTWYHPNITGHQQIGKRLSTAVGVPSTVNAVDGNSSDIDIAFVVDTTGSMGGTIDAVRENIRSIVSQVRAKSSTARFALVEYRDHPSDGGDSSDYPSRVDSGFTTDVAALQSALDSLEASGGGDWEETVYSGIMSALSLDWRPGVKKSVVVLGDAQAKDPEPVTGYTWASVAQRAFEIDPAEVYAVDTGGLVSEQFQSLVTQSGGTIYPANDTDDVPGKVSQAVSTALEKPFGWLQGPILGRVGTSVAFDARGSYAVEGQISSYEWDFDGDGDYDTTTAEPTTSHTYDAEFEGVAGVRVTDSSDQMSVGSSPVLVSQDGDAVPSGSDNCPDTENGDQSDADQDGLGDACDPSPSPPAKDAPGVFEIADGRPSIPAQTATIRSI